MAVRYLLDTNVCVMYLNGRSLRVCQRLRSINLEDVVVCSVVKTELFYGAWRSTNPEQALARQQRFLATFVSLPFDDRAAEIAGQIRAQLADVGTPIGSNDLLIAALAKRLRRRFALANNLTLVTHNIREFSRVEALQIEDWETE